MSAAAVPTKDPIYQHIEEAVQAIRLRSPLKPMLGIILGSGLGQVADALTEAVTIPYPDIPHFHATAVVGHLGKLVLGKLQGVPTVVLQGRFHLYEGYPMHQVVLPTRALVALGVETLILTNAAGGINTRYRAGDLMLIEDHLNLMGDNPLRGPNLAEHGPRFPDLSRAYDPDCLEILRGCLKETGLQAHGGVYAGLLGPAYETPAEVRMLRLLGADAVGMSTVPETIAARHQGVRVAGVSVITNLAAGILSQPLTHDEVIDIGKQGAEKLTKLLLTAAPKLAAAAAAGTAAK